jgi:hypothetical protein
MKTMKKTLKKIIRFLIDNYFLSIFFACIAFVALVSFYKLFIAKPTYVYVKVKVGQGLWWASTQKPSIWFVKYFQKGDQELDLTGRPIAEILSVRYYPWWGSNQYDVYLIMKLKVKKMSSGKYNFKRSAIGVGAPVDFEFPKVQFSGTIIELSEKPIKEKLTIKNITFVKKWAYPWEAETVVIGDKYFDGEEVVFEIIDKKTEDSQEVYNLSGIYYPVESERKKNITIKGRIKVSEKNGKFVFGEEQIIAPGKTINLATQNFQFQDYLVAKVE